MWTGEYYLFWIFLNLPCVLLLLLYPVSLFCMCVGTIGHGCVGNLVLFQFSLRMYIPLVNLRYVKSLSAPIWLSNLLEISLKLLANPSVACFKQSQPEVCWAFLVVPVLVSLRSPLSLAMLQVKWTYLSNSRKASGFQSPFYLFLTTMEVELRWIEAYLGKIP